MSQENFPGHDIVLLLANICEKYSFNFFECFIRYSQNKETSSSEGKYFNII